MRKQMNDPRVPGLQIWPSQATSHPGIHALLYSSPLESSLTLQPVKYGRRDRVWFLRIGHLKPCSFHLGLLECWLLRCY